MPNTLTLPSARHWLVTLSLAAAAVAAQAAAPKAMDAATTMSRLREARRITLTLVEPRATLFRSRLDLVHLEQVGCRFTTDDPGRIQGLVDIFDRGSVQAAGAAGRGLDLRYAVVFTLTDGSDIRILFEDNFNGAHDILGKVQEQPVSGSANLPADLRTWAFGSGPPKPEGACAADK